MPDIPFPVRLRQLREQANLSVAKAARGTAAKGDAVNLYTAWGSHGRATLLLAGDLLPDWMYDEEPGLEMLKVFEAETWEDACRQYYAWQGWEPYRPVPVHQMTIKQDNRESAASDASG